MTTTFRQLAARIESERAPAKADLPWLKLATFGDLTTIKGALRHDANLVSVTGVEGDYDAGEVSPAEAVARLRAANLAGIIYTTPTHTPAAPRWRALCPTSSPMTPADRDAMCDRLNAALSGILARESFARSQSYYFGATGDGRDHRVHLVDGRPIDKATELHKVAAPDPVTEPDDDDFDLESLIAPDFERIGGALAFIPADDREDWRTVGMALHSESKASDAGFDAWSEWSRASEKFDAKDQRRVWESFGRRPGKRVTIGSLYNLAKANGWNAKEAPAPSRLTFLTPSECQATPSRGYVVKGILAPGDVGCIFGAPGAGKSLIAPHIGYAVAQGRAAFGMRAKPGRVFYVAAEDPHGMRGRVTALKMRHGDAGDFTLVEGVSDLLSTDSQDLEALKSAVETQRPALIFLDTLAMAFPGLEENSAEAMGRVVAVARSLAQWGAAVVLIHHDTKAEGKTPRGHSLLNGALDMAMHVSRDDVGVVRAKLTKNRNGSCDRDLAFVIDTRVLCEDEDGDAITAALVDELASGSVPRAEKLTDSASAALAILTGLEADKPDNATCPGVPECEWRDACVAGRAVSGSENPDSRTKAFRRASKELAGQGRTIIIGDYVRSHIPLSNKHYFDDLGTFDE
ncbi:AAA family ATPase [Brevundimonas sp. TWP2-3-4b2]|uniref:AAA family ATPase n=1 Tax=Brevundimonas sp. TWP2-3-4b2 TaxID=2804595 RepID=UPI003CE85452